MNLNAPAIVIFALICFVFSARGDTKACTQFVNFETVGTDRVAKFGIRASKDDLRTRVVVKYTSEGNRPAEQDFNFDLEDSLPESKNRLWKNLPLRFLVRVPQNLPLPKITEIKANCDVYCFSEDVSSNKKSRQFSFYPRGKDVGKDVNPVENCTNAAASKNAAPTPTPTLLRTTTSASGAKPAVGNTGSVPVQPPKTDQVHSSGPLSGPAAGGAAAAAPSRGTGQNPGTFISSEREHVAANKPYSG